MAKTVARSREQACGNVGEGVRPSSPGSKGTHAWLRRLPCAVGLPALALTLMVAATACGTSQTGGAPAHATAGATATRQASVVTFREPITSVGLGCIMGAQESPDGKTIAVVATTEGCLANGTASDTVTVKLVLLDAHTGKPGATIDMEQAIRSQIHPAAGQTLTGVLVGTGNGTNGYTDWLWSPDSQQLAFLVQGITTDASGSSGEWLGAALVTPAAQPATQAVHVIPVTGRRSAAAGGPLSSYTPVGAAMLNTQAGTATWTQVPQAQAYTWRSDGSLAAQTPMPASASVVGAPTGGTVGDAYGTSFSLWQGASVYYAAPDCAAPYFALNLSRPAWSPTGQVMLTPGIQDMGRVVAALPVLATPTPGGYSPNCAGQPSPSPDSPAALAQFAPRDAGMRSALGLIQKNPSYPQAPSPDGLRFEWTPDGARVAVTSMNAATGPAPQVAVYDSASGKQLVDYSIPQLDPAYAVNATDAERNVLGAQWSPDGRSLMVYDGNVVVLLGNSALGG